jgi:Fe-S-cluster containining protein
MRYLEGEGADTLAARVALPQRHVTADSLRSKTVDALVKAYDDVAANGERICEAAWSEDPTAPQVECKKGCSFCCTQAVIVTISEIAAIVGFIGSLADVHRQTQLKERIAAVAARVKGLSTRAIFEARIDCPLLEEEHCAIYPVRPLACHGMDSLSRDKCETGYAGQTRSYSATIPRTDIRWITFLAVATGVRAGLVDVGLPGHTYELIRALDIALRQPDALSKWLHGSRVFEVAVDEGNLFTAFTD